MEEARSSLEILEEKKQLETNQLAYFTLYMLNQVKEGKEESIHTVDLVAKLQAADEGVAEGTAFQRIQEFWGQHGY